jgi:cytochrome c oxidase subunit 3
MRRLFRSSPLRRTSHPARQKQLNCHVSYAAQFPIHVTTVTPIPHFMHPIGNRSNLYPTEPHMPAVFTPTDTDRKRPSVDDGDHGSGRRPPFDDGLKRTGGGGDNDNWNDRPQGRRGPREKLERYRLGLFFALFGDLMFFVAIVTTFFVSKTSGHFVGDRYVNEWRPTAIPRILWLNTAILLCSSVTAELARRSIFHPFDVMEEWFGLGKPSTRRTLPWLSATIALGIAFLAGQTVAWRQLNRAHVFLRNNPSSHFFYLITYTHAFHLILGIAALIAALTGLYTSRQIENRQILVDCTVWYWHSMGLLWLFLFTLLAFFQ